MIYSNVRYCPIDILVNRGDQNLRTGVLGLSAATVISRLIVIVLLVITITYIHMPWCSLHQGCLVFKTGCVVDIAWGF